VLKLNESIPFGDKPHDILAVGEMLIDMVSELEDDAVNSGVYHRLYGGAAANLALNAKKLGLRPAVVSAVGKDGFGDYLIRTLAAEGIPTDLVQRVEMATTSMVVVTKSRTRPVPIFYRGADHRLSWRPDLEEAVRQSSIVHFTCWPISMPDSRATVERVLERARAEGALVGFDPNYHPSIWNRGEDGAAYVRSVIGRVDVIKPSEDDAARLFGEDTPENQLAKFLELGPRLVILTLGKDGALVSNGSETVRLDSVAEEVVDATGAGDAFWSGFYAGLLHRLTVHEALKLGMETSACKLKQLGPAAFPGVDELIATMKNRGMNK
jgi:fructokinase